MYSSNIDFPLGKVIFYSAALAGSLVVASFSPPVAAAVLAFSGTNFLDASFLLVRHPVEKVGLQPLITISQPSSNCRPSGRGWESSCHTSSTLLRHLMSLAVVGIVASPEQQLGLNPSTIIKSSSYVK